MVADAKGVPGGVSGNKMKQVICCDEGSEDMRSEVRRGAEIRGADGTPPAERARPDGL